MSNISNLEAVKIQARAVIPIVKALENELGKERAHQLVGETLAESWAEFTATRQAPGTHPASGADQGFPVERTIVKDADDVYAVNMTRCKFADYFRRIGEPEIGALLTCGVDFAVERRMRPDWTFSRSKTLMQGASHCDFSWSRKRSAADQ